MTKLKAVLFIGPQGSGKGTQARLFCERYGFAYMASGDLLREESQRDTERGRMLRTVLEQGSLVANEVTFSIIEDALKELPATSHVVFDGYPRTKEQAEMIETIAHVVAVVNLTLTPEESIKRIKERLTCPKGHIYNVTSLVPRVSGICDLDGLPLVRRSDDTDEAVVKRLEIYEKESAQLLKYYSDKGVLHSIDGYASISEVASRIERALAPYVAA